MFCFKCGNKLSEGAVFCHNCGAKAAKENNTVQSAITSQLPDTTTPVLELSENNQLLGSVEYKSGKIINFYDDYIQTESIMIKYNDIASLKVSMSEWFFYILFFIPVVMTSKTFIQFKLHNGQSFQIKTGGFSILGIGNKRKSQKRFMPVVAAVNEIVAPIVSDTYISKIRQGETIKIEGVKLDKDSAIYHIDPRKEPIIITRDNYGGCSFEVHFFSDNETLDIKDKNNNILFKLNSSQENVFVLRYILEELFK
jgi:hypothetical protein